MKKFVLLLTLSAFPLFSPVDGASKIRQIAALDVPVLTGMIASNPELLLPGRNLAEQVAATSKFFTSKNYNTLVWEEKKVSWFTTYETEGLHFY